MNTINKSFHIIYFLLLGRAHRGGFPLLFWGTFSRTFPPDKLVPLVAGFLNHFTPKFRFWSTFSRTFPPDKLVPLVAGFLNHFTPKFRFASTFSRTFPSDKLVTHSKRKENHHLFCHPEQHKMSVVKELKLKLKSLGSQVKGMFTYIVT